MAYGFETRDPSGNVLFSTADSTWTLTKTFTAPANTAVSALYFGGGGFTEWRITRHMLGQTVGDDEAYVHTYVANFSTKYIRAVVPDSSNTVATAFMIFGR